MNINEFAFVKHDISRRIKHPKSLNVGYEGQENWEGHNINTESAFAPQLICLL